MSTEFGYREKTIGDADAIHVLNESKDIGLELKGTDLPVFPGQNRKRRLQDEEMKVHKVNGARKLHFMSSIPSNRRLKRLRTPKIIGQKLPVDRLIEVLDRSSLQGLLQTLVEMHPEVSNTVDKISPKPSLSSCIELIKEKYDSIIKHLPYKCDVESDYSYLRVKPHLSEFFNCLSDIILSYLPPIESNLSVSLRLLDEITGIVGSLPNFTSSEFHYTKQMAYEQIANTWLIVLNHLTHIDDLSNSFSGSHIDSTTNTSSTSVTTTATLPQSNLDGPIQLSKIVHELGLEDKLLKYDTMSNGRFKNVIDFIKSEIENYESFHHTLHNNRRGLLSDLITVDYSSYSLAAKTSH